MFYKLLFSELKFKGSQWGVGGKRGAIKRAITFEKLIIIVFCCAHINNSSQMVITQSKLLNKHTK